jgi:hypothetical protein
MLPDRPPRRGVASDSEIRPTSSRDKLYLDPVAHAPGRPFHPQHTGSAPQYQPRHTVPLSSIHDIFQNRYPVRLQHGRLAQSEARRRPVRPSSSGVGLDQPSFVYRTTLNESLFSTSLRSLGGPTLTPALTPPKPARCGPSCPSIRLVLLGYRWRMDGSFRTNIPSTAKASQVSVSLANNLTIAPAPDCGRPWHAWPKYTKTFSTSAVPLGGLGRWTKISGR